MTEAQYQTKIAQLEYELAVNKRTRHDFFTCAALQNPLFFTGRDLDSALAIAKRARRVADACINTQPEIPPKPMPREDARDA